MAAATRRRTLKRGRGPRRGEADGPGSARLRDGRSVDAPRARRPAAGGAVYATKRTEGREAPAALRGARRPPASEEKRRRRRRWRGFGDAGGPTARWRRARGVRGIERRLGSGRGSAAAGDAATRPRRLGRGGGEARPRGAPEEATALSNALHREKKEKVEERGVYSAGASREEDERRGAAPAEGAAARRCPSSREPSRGGGDEAAAARGEKGELGGRQWRPNEGRNAAERGFCRGARSVRPGDRRCGREKAVRGRGEGDRRTPALAARAVTRRSERGRKEERGSPPADR